MGRPFRPFPGEHHEVQLPAHTQLGHRVQRSDLGARGLRLQFDKRRKRKRRGRGRDHADTNADGSGGTNRVSGERRKCASESDMDWQHGGNEL